MEQPMKDTKERFAYLKYVGHIAMMTGKAREAVSIDGIDTISDLLSRLDDKYPGLREVFIPTNGIFNSRTGIILRKVHQVSPVIDKEQKVQSGDTITFW